ncbi:MAG: hypothetical protein Q8R37_06215 [Nanoarchaeota archaeon]|nr:hypothetical protein [Nanoarchaeota archaeon]
MVKSVLGAIALTALLTINNNSSCFTSGQVDKGWKEASAECPPLHYIMKWDDGSYCTVGSFSESSLLGGERCEGATRCYRICDPRCFSEIDDDINFLYDNMENNNYILGKIDDDKFNIPYHQFLK